MWYMLLVLGIPAAIAYYFWGYWGLGISLVSVYLFFTLIGHFDPEDEESVDKLKPKGFEKRRKLALALLNLEEESKIVILVTETTGLDKGAEIIEIAIIRLDGTVLMNSLVKPKSKIPKAANLIFFM